MPSQKLRVLAYLQTAGDEGISSRWFIQNYLPRVAARVLASLRARFKEVMPMPPMREGEL